jgi:predicted phosphodiesterase
MKKTATPVMLITGDWHVRSHDRVWYKRPGLCGDTAFGIAQVVEIAKAVPYVLLLGDLFEQKPQQPDAVELMRMQLDVLCAHSFVMFVQGQHEKAKPPWLQALHSRPKHIHGATMNIPELGRQLYGLDYQQPAIVKEALQATPEGTILATHQVWKDFLGDARGDAWMHAANVDTILTGDFHKTIVTKLGDRQVVSPGPLCMQNIGEPANKYVVLMSANGTFEERLLRSRKCFRVHINNDDELDAFLASWQGHPARTPQVGVPANISTNMLQVHYRTDLPEVKQRLEARLGSEVHLFLMPVPPENTVVAADAVVRRESILAGGMEGCLRTFYGQDQEILADALRLCRCADSALDDELNAIFKERLSK